MKLKDLKPYGISILNYCSNKEAWGSMLDALDEDLAVDRYQDTQPGGGNCVSDNRKRYKIYLDKLSELTSASVFGELYQNATSNEKSLLDELLDLFEENYKDKLFYVEVELSYQMSRFLDYVCDTTYAEKDFSSEDIQLLEEGGKYFVDLAAKTFDEKIEEYTFIPSKQLTLEFLNEKNLLNSVSLNDRILNAQKQQKQGNTSAKEKQTDKIK